MDQFVEFFVHLFDTADWPARWVCGKWSEFHGWLYIYSDIAIWLAYFIIPVIIIWFIQHKPNIQFLPVFWLFGAFIILCGTTHLIDALIFWWPAYRLSALLRFLTAVVSFTTVIALIRDLPKLLNINSPGQNDNKLKLLNEQLNERNFQIKSLQNQIAKLKEPK